MTGHGCWKVNLTLFLERNKMIFKTYKLIKEQITNLFSRIEDINERIDLLEERFDEMEKGFGEDISMFRSWNARQDEAIENLKIKNTYIKRKQKGGK